MPELYLSVSDLRATFGHRYTVDDSEDLLTRAIGAASAQIDEWAGPNRHFFAASGARVFLPVSRWLVDVGYFSTKAGVMIQTDDNNDGVFETTWTSDQWRTEPVEAPTGRPYEQIVACGTQRFPVNGRRPGVKVTASWGWAEVPEPIRQACQILSVVYYKSKDFTGGQVGFDDETNANSPASPYAMARKLVLDTVHDKDAAVTA